MDTRGVGQYDCRRSALSLPKTSPLPPASIRWLVRPLQTGRGKSSARFYKNCREQKPGKKGYPRFQHDNRSVEYKTSGWRLEPDGQHITFTDGMVLARCV